MQRVEFDWRHQLSTDSGHGGEITAPDGDSNRLTEPGHMSRLLVIVARDLPQLFDYLAVRFTDLPDVAVILDRRGGERRQPVRAGASERRDARDAAAVRARGYLITRSRAWDLSGHTR